MKVNDWTETLWGILNIRPRTLLDYKRLYRRQLEPVIGNTDINEVASIDLQKKLLTLPPQTSRHTLMLAKTIWREALLYGVTDKNPTTGLRSPKIQETPKKFFTWEEVDERDWGTYNEQIRFLALHGLRWSEAAVIEESDIHDGFVWVNRSFHGPVKSRTSIRRVPYLGHFERFPMSYKPLQKAANRHGVTVHSFRRTYAYLLKTQGIHVTTAQKLLGHSDPMMTLKVYTSVLDDEIDAALQKLHNAIEEVKEN